MKRALSLVAGAPKPAKVARTDDPRQTDEKWLPQIQTALHTMGIQSLRPGQKPALLAALEGRDAFVLMPTGGGKSLCYTLPALCKTTGVVIVISPLIALMQDQVSALHGKLPCAYLSSTLTDKEREDIKGRQLGITTSSGNLGVNYMALPRTHSMLRMLFVTPESLNNEDFKARLQALYRKDYLNLFAVDEAHCISSWGHDFRPAYRWLGNLRRYMPRVPIMALTATAKPEVQSDIIKQLRLNGDGLVRVASSFDRPNIRYAVLLADTLHAPLSVPAQAAGRTQLGMHEDDNGDSSGGCADAASGGPGVVVGGATGAAGLCVGGFLRKQTQKLCCLIQEHVGQAGEKGCAIVYVRKKEDAEKLAAYIPKAMPRSQLRIGFYHAGVPGKQRTQVNADWKAQRLDVVVATVAFGMGLDRPNVRLVVHWNLPGSLEGYYQESGRAGRDGAPAQAVLFYNSQDKQSLEFLVHKAKREADAKKASSGALPKGGVLGPVMSVGSMAQVTDEPESDHLVRSFDKVVAYAKRASCRRAALLAHFSESFRARNCGNCDFCCDPEGVAGSVSALASVEAQQAFQRMASRGSAPRGWQGGWQHSREEEEEEEGGEGGWGGEEGPDPEQEDFGQGAVVLDDVPRTAVERLHDQQDRREVQAAARSATAAKQRLGAQAGGMDGTMAYLAAMEAAEKRDAGRRAGAGPHPLQLQPSLVRQQQAPAPGVTAELRNSSVARLADRLACAPCARGLDGAALQIVAVSVEGVVHKEAGGHRQSYSGALSRAASRFLTAPSVLALPLQLLDELQGSSSATTIPAGHAIQTGIRPKPSEGQLRMLGALLLAELDALKQQAAELSTGAPPDTTLQQQQQQQQLETPGSNEEYPGQDAVKVAVPVPQAGRTSCAHAAPSCGNRNCGSGGGNGGGSGGDDRALLGRLQALASLPCVPLEVLKMGVGKSSGELKKMCERALAASHPQIAEGSRSLVEAWRRQLQKL